jgi:hypothetical protein
MSGLAAGFNDKHDIKEEFPSLEIVVPILCDKISNNEDNLESNEGTEQDDGGTKEGKHNSLSEERYAEDNQRRKSW